jgi:hypothetical protein
MTVLRRLDAVLDASNAALACGHLDQDPVCGFRDIDC